MKIIDLSLIIEEGMQTFCSPWHPKVEISQLGRIFQEGRETRKVLLGSHTGTHVDAPLHFISKGASIDTFPLDLIAGNASLVDFSDLPHFSEIDSNMLSERLGERDSKRIILRFNWGKEFNSKLYYSHHPYLSEEACDWLVKKGCQLLAMDTPQPDNPKNGYNSENDAPNHKILLKENIFLVEYLCNLEKILTDVCFFCCSAT